MVIRGVARELVHEELQRRHGQVDLIGVMLVDLVRARVRLRVRVRVRLRLRLSLNPPPS